MCNIVAILKCENKMNKYFKIISFSYYNISYILIAHNFMTSLLCLTLTLPGIVSVVRQVISPISF